jgi:hypothetical protein
MKWLFPADAIGRSCPNADTARCGAHLLFSLPADVVAISVKNQVGDLPIRLSEELQLGIHHFQEELALRFLKDRGFC